LNVLHTLQVGQKKVRQQISSINPYSGGYFSGFKRLMEKCENLGFPIAELEADGSCTITKEANTGGEVRETIEYLLPIKMLTTPQVSVGTVASQLLYEVSTK
jgi:hypothetical protein